MYGVKLSFSMSAKALALTLFLLAYNFAFVGSIVAIDWASRLNP